MSWRREMMDGYIMAAQWSSSHSEECDDGHEEYIEMDEVDLAPGQEMRLGLAVSRWARGFMPSLERAAELLEGTCVGHTGWEMVGHNVWLSQVGHGTGFWDRTELDVGGLGDWLSDASKLIGESAYGYVEDGLGYFEGFNQA